MAQHPTPQGSARADGLTRGEWIAFVICIVWMLVGALYFWQLPPAEAVAGQTDSLRWVLVLVALFMPVGLVWVAVGAARAARIMQAETFRMQTALDDLRQLQLAQAALLKEPPAPAAPPQAKTAPPEPDLPAQTSTQTSTQTPGFHSRREVSRLITPRAAPQMPADQPALAFGTQTEDLAPPLARPDLIRALHFPDDENDTEGFAALRRALRNRDARKLVQASQDVLTLLSHDGIYTDDMRPTSAPADVWRRFAKGERGRSIDRLGAVRDEAYLRKTASRMREDTIFRDAVHHFLRRFDEMLVTFEENATDTDLLALGETRTARAFMLLARTSGTFD
ncbi:hypothetical protein [Yoonia sp.]|uniref:hypothetical protein n=1 Tax=Yoonia sp. TaxID=2212373 RepID=UPI002FD99165